MTLTSEALERLAAVLKVLDATCKRYEQDCPGAAECGYWTMQEKDQVELAKNLLVRVKMMPLTTRLT